jgi:hypothetical protein
MGTNCSSHPGPNSAGMNICDGAIGDEQKVKNFCAVKISLGGAGSRGAYCNNISSAGEWSFSREYGSCFYDGDIDYGFGCCGTTCGQPFGTYNVCKRGFFSGDPLICCLNNSQCSTSDNPSECYSDVGRNNTCDPTNRSISGDGCRQLVEDYCTGTDVTGTSIGDHSIQNFYNRWQGTVTTVNGITASTPYTNICYKALWNNLYRGEQAACTGAPGLGIVTTNGYVWVQEMFSKFLAKYAQLGGVLALTEGQVGTTTLNSMIWGICNQYPGICSAGLNQYCAPLTNDSLLRNPEFLKWCGCYMQPGQYSKYTDTYLIPLECTPTCNNPNVIPLATQNGLTTKTCKQSQCVIDDFAISLANAQFPGGINFSQVCSGCSNGLGQTCSCSITGTTLIAINRDNGALNVSQNCGSNSTCYNQVTNPDGTTSTISVPCSAPPGFDPYTAIKAQSSLNYDNAIRNRNFKILIIFIVVIIILIILWNVFMFKKKPTITSVSRHR